MQFFADFTDFADQRVLNVHVHVFERNRPGEPVVLNSFADRIKAGDDLFAFSRSQHADFRQHRRVGNRPLNVAQRQALVEVDRCGKCLNKGIRRSTESPAP